MGSDGPVPGAGADAQPASLARQTAIGAAWMVGWRVATRLLGLASTLILARLLVPSDFGLIAMASTFAAAVEQMSQIGLQDALVRRRGAASELFDTAFTLQLVRSLMTASVLAASAPTAVWWFAEPRLLPLLLVLATGCVISGLENVAIAQFRRDMRFDVQFKLLLVPRLLQVALTIALALWLQSYWALLAGTVIGKIGRTVMTYRVHPLRPRLRLMGWRELAGFSFWTWATTLVSVVWDRCDPFVFGPALGSAQLGVYLLAFELALLPVTELIAPVGEALFAGFAVAQHQGASSMHLAPLVATSLFLCTSPMVVAISAAGPDIVSAFLGPQWAAAGPLVAILAWAGIFSPFSFVCQSVLIANGRMRRNFVANLIASCIRLTVLVVAVALSDHMAVLAAAATGCFFLESVIFVVLLTGTGVVRLRDGLGGGVRGAISTAIAAGVLIGTGLGWRSAPGPALCSALHAIIIGGLAVAVFVMCNGVAWMVAGRPDGPETTIVRLLFQPVVMRLRRVALAYVRLG